MKTLLRIKVLALVVFLFILLSTAQYTRVATGSKIMMSAHPLAAKAGLEVYQKGSNVVDVAVAVACALGVVEPHGSGIGGEGMMLIYIAKEKKSTIVDFKDISPLGASYRTLDLTWNRIAESSKKIPMRKHSTMRMARIQRPVRY